MTPPARQDEAEAAQTAHNPMTKWQLAGDPAGQRALAQARRDAIAAGAHFRRDFADASAWDERERARQRGLRLPARHGRTPGRSARRPRSRSVARAGH
jgi:hypothetical protein